MIIARLAALSLKNRALTASLTVLAIAVSVMMFLGVEKIRTGARQSFTDTISGTDLVVGARSGALQLLLYSVFRIGNATNNITWKTYEEIAAHPEVDWIVPLSLGDSHRGYRVLGTTPAYFERYKYRHRKSLSLTEGTVFDDLFDVVIGADVSATLGYKVGDSLILGHGLGAISFVEHEDKPFRVAGILGKTGTPVDKTLHVSLEAIEAIHIDWQSGMPSPGQEISAAEARKVDLAPKAVTAALVGLHSRLATFKLQRAINQYRAEPLSAIIPGAALQELWSLVSTAETALSVISALVVATALLGMMTSILTSLNERRREMAILRSVGARPTTILGLLTAEAALLTILGVALGLLFLYGALFALGPIIDKVYGLAIAIEGPALKEWLTLGAIVAAGLAAGLVPAIRAYRLSLADGMTIRT
jgi:putative ABC transport system permease protein